MSKNSMSKLRKPDTCPKCAGKTILHICYGIPNKEAWELIDSGQGTLGGCFITPWMSDWECGSCHHRWFDSDDPVKQEMEQLLADILAKSAARQHKSKSG
jgi:hypothetical protein